MNIILLYISSVATHYLTVSMLHKGMAYLDPGTGSFLLQLLAAGVLGGLFVLRASWSKVRDFFLRLFGKEVETPDDEE